MRRVLASWGLCVGVVASLAIYKDIIDRLHENKPDKKARTVSILNNFMIASAVAPAIAILVNEETIEEVAVSGIMSLMMLVAMARGK